MGEKGIFHGMKVFERLKSWMTTPPDQDVAWSSKVLGTPPDELSQEDIEYFVARRKSEIFMSQISIKNLPLLTFGPPNPLGYNTQVESPEMELLKSGDRSKLLPLVFERAHQIQNEAARRSSR